MAINIYCSKVAIGDVNDGTSWTNAYLTLEEAFIDANSRPISDGEVTVFVDYNDYTLSTFTMTRLFNIIGTDENLNGIYTKTILYLDELNISYSDQYIDILFQNLYFISTIPTPTINYDVLYNSGSLTINSCNANIHIFVNSISESIVNIYDSNISSASTTVVGTYLRLNISKSKILSNQSIIDTISKSIIINYSKLISQATTINIPSGSPLNLIISYSLLKYDVTIDNSNSDLQLDIVNCTIDGTIQSSVSINNNVTFNNDLLLSDILDKIDVAGILTYTNSAYIIEPISPDISTNNKLIIRPQFKNESQGDYTLMHGYGITLDAFELLDKNKNIEFNIKSLKIRETNLLERYTYKFQNTLTLTNYMLERKFADLLFSYNYYTIANELEYNIHYKKIFNITNQKTEAAFTLGSTGVTSLWPYEWDYFKIDTPEVEPKSYIIPRSVIDISDIIRNEFTTNTNVVSIQNFKIITMKKIDHYGLAYDYFISDNTNKFLWSVNEQNILTLTNVYNGSVEANYPLMSKLITAETTLIQPSGLIKYGNTTDGYYNYTLEDNPNVVIKGIDDDYKFEWLCTEIDDTYEFGGMLAYKGNIFIGVKYTNSDETKLLVYPSRGTFKNYSSLTPVEINIPTSGLFPSDMTVLEDGTFLISNSNNNTINHYQPIYDYALIRSNTKDDTKLLLREQYEDIKL